MTIRSRVTDEERYAMRRRTRFLTAAVAVAAALALAACGSDTPAEPDQPAAGPTTGAPDGTPTTGAPADGSDSDAGSVPESLAFTGTTVGGERYDAAELAGEPAMLWFWAPWCPICRAAAPDVLAASEQVSVVGVGGLDEDSAMQGFVDSTGTGSLTHLSDPAGEVWQKFGVTTQDTYVLIDADGEVVHNGSLSGDQLRERVAELAG